MERDERLKVLELLLWMTDRPLKTADILHIIGDPGTTEMHIREELSELGRVLDERQAPFHVAEVAQGFQLASRPAFSQWVRKLYREKTALRLSPSALETLSIIAYKQPLTRGEVEDIRGVDVSGTLETLLERKLVKIVGRKEALGRPLLYGTTTDFMKQFGLRSLDELPRLEELLPTETSGAEASPSEETPLSAEGPSAPVSSQEPAVSPEGTKDDPSGASTSEPQLEDARA